MRKKALYSELFVPAVLKDGTPIAEKHRGECIERIQRGLERRGSFRARLRPWARGEQKRSLPVRRNSNRQFGARSKTGRGFAAEAGQQIFSAVAKCNGVTESEDTGLVKAQAPEH